MGDAEVLLDLREERPDADDLRAQGQRRQEEGRQGARARAQKSSVS
jgi:hypothetical protein